MKNAINPKEWAKDFQDFLNVPEQSPSEAVSGRVFSIISKSLNPAPWTVFSKLALVQAVVGTLTLLFCPQFGISIFPGMGLMSLFMNFGEIACMAACGVVFLGAGALIGSFILRPEEVKVIRRHKMLQLALLGTLSLGTFICLGASVVVTLGIAWFIGSTLGGIATLELGWRLRSYLRRKVIYGF